MDLWGRADACDFAPVPLEGDGQVVARVVRLQTTAPWAKAGLMVRASLLPGSPHAALVLTPGNGVSFQHRPAEGAETLEARRKINADGSLPLSVRQPVAPCWLKLVRQGNLLSGYSSKDGLTWDWEGTATVPLPAQVLAGLVAASASSSRACLASFDGLAFGPAPPPDLAKPLVGTGDGLRGTYFLNVDQSGPSWSRVDGGIDFDWTSQAPLTNLDRERFSVRWEGQLQAQFTEPYAFHVTSDDQARLWVNGQLLIDETSGHAAQESSGLLQLEAGVKYLVRLDYFQRGQAAVARLLWSSPSTPKQVVPQHQLYSAALDADGDGLPDLWELAYGLNPKDPADAQTDPDGDGLTNLEEYLAGLNPLVPDLSRADLPAPWVSQDVGRPRQKGQARAQAGLFGLAGAGADIWGNADNFHFVHQTLAGDGELVGRVVRLQNTDPWAKAGLMLRASVRDDSPQVLLALSPENGLSFQVRTNLGGTTTADPGGPATAPCWLKLVRQGRSFSAFRSSDGARWDWVATETLDLPGPLQAGLALSSHNPAKVCSALFDQVSLIPTAMRELPTPIVGSGDGLWATYFDLATQKLLERLDPTVDFDWGAGAPAKEIAADHFSVRWEGMIEAQHSEPYAFHVVTDDGVRLWVGGAKILEGWTDRAATKMSATTLLKAGQKYLVKMEYYERTGFALARLLWSSPSTPRQPIPQSQLYSPKHPLYAALEDKDGDGLPDSWEKLYGLNETDPSDAAADPDHDGLTNLQEYLAGANPLQADTDGDGLPDGWEAANGLNPLAPADARHDDDHDGLTNLEEYLAGTNPKLEDSDGDGLSDGAEVNETGTNPMQSDIEKIVPVTEVTGATAIGRLGRWTADGTALHCDDRRGYVEYLLNVPQAGMYRLELEGAAYPQAGGHDEFQLLLSLDGEDLGRSFLVSDGGTNGLAHRLTPWLLAGDHRVRVYWDNAAPRLSFNLIALRLQSLQGPDSTGSGVMDWVEARLRRTCGVDAGPVWSTVSPLCVEGRGAFLSLMQISGGVAPQPGAGDRWYANVPLAPRSPAEVVFSFQNGALRLTNQYTWRPANVLQRGAASDRGAGLRPAGSGVSDPGNDESVAPASPPPAPESGEVTLRVGDSLLVWAVPTNGSAGRMSLSVPGLTNYEGEAVLPVPIRFETSGEYVVNGSHVSTNGTTETGRLNVRVLAARFPDRPAVWQGKARSWDCPGLPGAVVLEADPRLACEEIASPTNQPRQFNLGLDAPETRGLVARLGTNGPVLTNTPAEGFRLYSSSETGVFVVETYPDGSRLVEMVLVLSPVRPQVAVHVDIIVGGITFDDGSLSKILQPADFGELGEARVRFIHPADAETSVCHKTRAYQGGVMLGIHTP